MTNSSKRQSERANVKRRLKGVFLDCPELYENELRVTNISETGMGLDPKYVHALPPIGKALTGRLVMAGEKIVIAFCIKRLDPKIIGLEFLGSNEILKNAIRKFFEAELIGAKMRKISNPARIKLGEPYTHRYTDGRSNELEVTVLDSQVVEFNFKVLGISVEWKQGSAIFVEQNNQRTRMGEQLRNQLLKLVHSLDALDPHLQEDIEAIIVESPSALTRSA